MGRWRTARDARRATRGPRELIPIKDTARDRCNGPAMLIKNFAIPFGMALLLALGGCGGGGSETQIQNTTVSKGQALIDIKKALDSGAISQAEYDRERKRILDQ